MEDVAITMIKFIITMICSLCLTYTVIHVNSHEIEKMSFLHFNIKE